MPNTYASAYPAEMLCWVCEYYVKFKKKVIKLPNMDWKQKRMKKDGM